MQIGMKGRQRKPSLAVSRRFSVNASALVTGSKGKNVNGLRESKLPKVIWEGKDVTPHPLCPPGEDSAVSTKDIGFLRVGSDDETRLAAGADGSILWIADKEKTLKDPEIRLQQKVKEIAANNGKEWRGSRSQDKRSARRPTSAAKKKKRGKAELVHGMGRPTIILNETPMGMLLCCSGSAVANDAPNTNAGKSYIKTPLLESTFMSRRQMLPIQQVQWVSQGIDQGERLMSISIDGRVCSWSLTKGLALTPLMELKHHVSSSSTISQRACGES